MGKLEWGEVSGPLGGGGRWEYRKMSGEKGMGRREWEKGVERWEWGNGSGEKGVGRW